MNNFVTRAVDDVAGTARDFTGGLLERASTVKANVADTAKQALDYAVSLHEIKRNPPSQVTIADLFHRKLYDYVDFDYLIEYLRSNGIATCKHIFTINTLAKEVVPSLTEAALRERDVRKINATYAGIMRLCRRHRKGMIAYLSTEGHAQVCLIKSWDSFLQLAGFNNAATADKLVFNTQEIFPKLKLNRGIQAKVARYNEQAIEERRESSQSAVRNFLAKSEVSASDTTEPRYKRAEDLVDVAIDNPGDRVTTSLFKAGKDIDFAQILAMNYKKVTNSPIEWDGEHDTDLFIYYLVYKRNPEYKNISSLKSFFTIVSGMFADVGFNLNVKTIQQLSGDRLRDLKNALKLETVEVRDDIDREFDMAVLELADRILLSTVNKEASYSDIYNNENAFIKNKRHQLITQVNNSTALIRLPSEDTLKEYIKFIPTFENLVNTRNSEIFKTMWTAAVSGNLTDLDEDGFDKIACLLVYDKTKKIDMNLAEFDNELILTLNDLIPNASIDWNSLFENTEGDVLHACRIVRKITESNSSQNQYACELLRQAISNFYGFGIGKTEMWQQVYISICNAKKSSNRSGMTVMSGAEALGLAESSSSNVAADLDDMEL